MQASEWKPRTSCMCCSKQPQASVCGRGSLAAVMLLPIRAERLMQAVVQYQKSSATQPVCQWWPCCLLLQRLKKLKDYLKQHCEDVVRPHLDCISGAAFF